MHETFGRFPFVPWYAFYHTICYKPALITNEALGTQLKSLYRYGGRSQCGRKLEDFKFCMSLKSMDPDEKRDAWIRRRAEWWATRRLAKGSEDVWDARK